MKTNLIELYDFVVEFRFIYQIYLNHWKKRMLFPALCHKYLTYVTAKIVTGKPHDELWLQA